MADEPDAREAADRKIGAVELMWRHPWVRAVTYVAVAAFLIYVLWRLRGGYAFALQVGVIGFIIAYILNPVVEALQRLRIRRAAAVVIVYFLLLNLLVLGSVVVSQVVSEMGRFVNLIPKAIDNLTSLSGHVSAWLSGVLTNLPEAVSSRLTVPANQTQVSQQIRQELVTFTTELAKSLNTLLQHIVTGGPSLLLSGATAVISTTFQIVLIFIASAYFLYDYPRFTANFRRYVPVRWRPLYEDLTDKADRAVGGYLRGQVLITLTLGILIWLGLTVIGMPLATAISFLAAIFNLVPYLGPIIGVLPAVLLGLTVGPWTAVLAILVFLVANQLEAHVLSPIILSRSTNLHPVTVLLSIMAGLGLFGLVGALLAVPIVALVKVVLEEYLLTRQAYATVPPPPLSEDGPGSGEEG